MLILLQTLVPFVPLYRRLIPHYLKNESIKHFIASYIFLKTEHVMSFKLKFILFKSFLLVNK